MVNLIKNYKYTTTCLAAWAAHHCQRHWLTRFGGNKCRRWLYLEFIERTIFFTRHLTWLLGTNTFSDNFRQKIANFFPNWMGSPAANIYQGRLASFSCRFLDQGKSKSHKVTGLLHCRLNITIEKLLIPRTVRSVSATGCRDDGRGVCLLGLAALHSGACERWPVEI